MKNKNYEEKIYNTETGTYVSRKYSTSTRYYKNDEGKLKPIKKEVFEAEINLKNNEDKRVDNKVNDNKEFIDDETLNKLLERHKLYIESGKVQGSCLNLTDIDLSGKDLSGLDLTDARFFYCNLHQVNLKGSKLVNAYLQDTDFSDSNLENTDFTNASMGYCNFENSNLRNTVFNCTFAPDTNFKGADLTNAIFVKAELIESDFTNAILKNTNFRNADLRGAILETNLKDTNIKGARFLKNINLNNLSAAEKMYTMESITMKKRTFQRKQETDLKHLMLEIYNMAQKCKHKVSAT